MADETFQTIFPSLKAVDNGDGTFSIAVNIPGMPLLSGMTIGDLLIASSATALSLVSSSAEGKVLEDKGAGVSPAWNYRVEEIWLPAIAGVTSGGGASMYGNTPPVQLVAGQYVAIQHRIPDSFVALVAAKMCFFPAGGNGTYDWTIQTTFSNAGEAYNASTDSDTANTVSGNNEENVDLDVSAAFTGLAAGDEMSAKFFADAFDTITSLRVWGLMLSFTAKVN